MQPKAEQQFLNKQNEIRFRRKLATQQTSEGQVLLPEVHSKKEILEVIQERIKRTQEDINTLIKKGTKITPYIELGAERCQRALVLENEFNANGFALDISFEMLRYSEVISKEFGYNKMPLRIACDAYNLPFQNDSLEFALCYQTLHHFPNPVPICKEIARVLQGNGVFFFDEEPLKGLILKLTRFYHQGYRLNILERLLKKLGLLGLLAKSGDLEREHGILEEEFDISTWLCAVSEFQEFELVVNRRKCPIKLNSLNRSLRNTLAQLIGGSVQAFCRITKPELIKPTNRNLLDILGCPNCTEKQKLVRLSGFGFKCPQCESTYPEIDGILLMFEKSLGSKLYPEYLQ